jgi:hypothetical protein
VMILAHLKKVLVWIATCSRLYARFFVAKSPGWDDLFVVLAAVSQSSVHLSRFRALSLIPQSLGICFSGCNSNICSDEIWLRPAHLSPYSLRNPKLLDMPLVTRRIVCGFDRLHQALPSVPISAHLRARNICLSLYANPGWGYRTVGVFFHIHGIVRLFSRTRCFLEWDRQGLLCFL